MILFDLIFIKKSRVFILRKSARWCYNYYYKTATSLGMMSFGGKENHCSAFAKGEL